jgi:hypothetical protein
MYYTFFHPRDFDAHTILAQMKSLVEKKSDVSDDPLNVLNMIVFMLPRKKETIYKKINQRNIARHLVSFIPKDSFEEIKRKADLNDPVRAEKLIYNRKNL